MHNLYDVIEIDNYFILKTFQIFHIREYSCFVYQVGLKTCRTNLILAKNFKTNIILITKYLNLDWSIAKSVFFYKKND